MENRVFFPQSLIDRGMVEGTVDLRQNELTIVPANRRYKVVDAVHVLREVSETGDGRDLVGRVKERAVLEQLGAEIVENSMLLGDSAFDVEPGWVGVPETAFAEHVASAAPGNARKAAPDAEPLTDEDLLIRSLVHGS